MAASVPLMVLPVTVTGNTISGTDAANYALVQQSGLTANVTQANLSVTGLTASNKTYDTTTNATLGGTASVTLASRPCDGSCANTS